MLPSFPQKRMRRLRGSEFTRRLVRERSLAIDDLIQPLFLLDSDRETQAVPAMPGVERLGADPLLKKAELCLELGIPAVALFPVVDPQLKTVDGSEAYNPDGLVQRRIRALKARFPQLGIITDVALDPYTTHGHDGLMDSAGTVLNDETLAILRRQAVSHAEAGCDIVAPSDMMDGRICTIRNALDDNGFTATQVLAYSAKFASAFYGPFREALGSKNTLNNASKDTYQLDPANSEQALLELLLDMQEGADILMVKPGLPYLDIIRVASERCLIPIFAYQVSGEYSMLKAAIQNAWLNEKACIVESLLCFKRAGCAAIFTYFAMDAAKFLLET